MFSKLIQKDVSIFDSAHLKVVCILQGRNMSAIWDDYIWCENETRLRLPKKWSVVREDFDEPICVNKK